MKLKGKIDCIYGESALQKFVKENSLPDPKGELIRKRCEIHNVNYFYYSNEVDYGCPVCTSL